MQGKSDFITGTRKSWTTTTLTRQMGSSPQGAQWRLLRSQLRLTDSFMLENWATKLDIYTR